MNSRLTSIEISKVLQKSIQKNLFSKEDTTLIFHDLSFLKKKIEQLKESFLKNALHAIAAKANPLPTMLEYLKSLDVGCEAATLSEVYLALKAGYPPDKIVFDSPAKTREELEFSLKKGIHINADSFIELDRIAEIKKHTYSPSNIGIRINPQIGSGNISTTSVAGKYSKFGVPLDEYKQKLLEYFQKYPWINGIHSHIGSQGNPMEQLIIAAKKIENFIISLPRILNWIDIGGGLPVNYFEGFNAPDFKIYWKALFKECPDLFSGKYKIITEFGRSIHANTGWTASKVEYVKSYSNTKTAVIHVGADLFMRRCYQPEHWHHDFSVCNGNGNLKTGATEKITIAGPLCFNGDILGRDITIPPVEEGDYIIIHDSGGYTLSMWSRHTSRLIPKVVGYTNQGKSFQVLKEAESLDDLYNFWS